MKIAFVGKGGSGKTTLTALMSQYLAATGATVWAIDADINQHLAAALGADSLGVDLLGADSLGDSRMAPLGEHLDELKEYLRGDNPRIVTTHQMVKTTPPGRGSRLLTVTDDNPIYRRCVGEVGGVRLSVTGGFAEEDLGVSCYHSKVGAVELLLNHLVDADDEYVIVDMTAGADSFASGLFTRFDRTVIVCEPTLRGVGVYRQYREYARDYGVAITVVGNKVTGPADETFLRTHVGADLLAGVGVSAHVRAAEQGRPRPIAELEPATADVLHRLRVVIDATERDWPRFTRQAHEFHLRNAFAWASAKAGTDVAAQIDAEFVLGPHALAATAG